jgi:hypothetical protein
MGLSSMASVSAQNVERESEPYELKSDDMVVSRPFQSTQVVARLINSTIRNSASIS